MKVNIPVRMKNPWFWVGIVSVAITAIGVDPQTFTSWAAVWDGIVSVLENPVQLCTMCLAVLSVFIDDGGHYGFQNGADLHRTEEEG